MNIHRLIDQGRYYIAETKQGLPVGVIIGLDDESYRIREKRLRTSYISSEGVVAIQKEKSSIAGK